MAFRPISLCNVIYKIIAKVLANRIKLYLLKLIDESQSVFVGERLITDNIIIAFEVFHWLKNGKERDRQYMAMKLDMSKAYDRVSWRFLR